MLSPETVAEIYAAIARRAPTETETARFVEAETEAAAIDAIYAEASADTVRAARFYQIYYNRLPDDGGLDFWTSVAPALDDQALGAAFFEAGEFDALYAGLEVEAAVRALYENVLGREADPLGLAFWTSRVTGDNGFGLGDLGLEFATAPETLDTFEPLSEAYLTALAAGEAARARLFDYIPDITKPEDATEIDDRDDKLARPSPVPLSAEGLETETTLLPLNADAADLMNLDALRADPRFADIDGGGLRVAVIDTGIDLDHPAFGPTEAGVSSRIAGAIDFTGEGDFTADDVDGHGSHVASIIASEDPDYLGVAPGAEIIALQALDNTGSGRAGDIEQALRWVVENAAAEDIVAVNLSLGDGSNVNRAGPAAGGYDDELAQLAALGVVVVAAAGNDYDVFEREGVSSLAADPNAIAVGAVWDDQIPLGSIDALKSFGAQVGDIAFFSQRSAAEGIETLFAPGALILGAAPGGGSVNTAGTSQAAPQIAGLAALAQEIALETLGRRLTPAEFEAALRAGAAPFLDSEIARDTVTNSNATYGLVDALAMAEAILALDGSRPPGTPVPEDVPGDAGTDALAAPGVSVAGAVETPFDRDWFALDVVAGARYEVTLQGAASGVGTLVDPLLAIRDADGRIIASDDDGGLGFESALAFRATEPGTVYVEARAFGDLTGSYRLEVDRLGGGGDLPAGRTTPSVLALDEITTGAIETLGDHDWHRLQLAEGIAYAVGLFGVDNDGGTLADPVLRVFDDDGAFIDADDDSFGRDSGVLIPAGPARTVYLDAGAFNEAGTGTYSLLATRAESEDLPADASTPRELTSGREIAETLELPEDVDWFELRLQRGVLYEIAVEGAGSGSEGLDLADPVLSIVGPTGAVFATDDDSGPGLDPLLEFRAPTTGSFYAAVSSYGGRSSGTYAIGLEDLGAADLANDPTTAASVAPGAVFAGELETVGDRDWVAIELGEAEVLTISLQGAGSGVGTLADPFLRVYGPDGSLIGADDDSAGSFESRLEVLSGQAGRYFIEAASYADEGAGSYRVQVSGTAPEPSDTIPASPRTEAALDRGRPFTDAIDFSGDEDWVEIQMIADVTYVVLLRGTGSDPLANPNLGIADASGNTLAFNEDLSFFDRDAGLVFTPETGGAYYAAVGGVDTGEYTLSTTFIEDTIVVGGALRGQIDFPGDEDWIAVSLQGGVAYRATLDGLQSGLGDLLDPVLAVYDADGLLLAENDDRAEGELESVIDFVAPEDGIYYLSARSFSGLEAEVDYLLSIA